MAEHSLDNLKVFQKALIISDLAWEILGYIPKPYRFSTGDQFLESSDSIAANIAEGYGRFGYKYKRKFFHNARGSLYESRTWFAQICKRFNILKDYQDSMFKELDNVGYLLNQYIRYLNSEINKR